MEIAEDNSLDEDFIIRPKSEKIKDQILDEDFQKAKTAKVTIKKKIKEKDLRKKPFFLLGIVLIIIGLTCFITVNFGPWMYIKYEPAVNENVTIEKIYFKDFQLYDLKDDKINNFFEENSSKYLGISTDDFSPYSEISIYVSYAFLVIGTIFTLIQILSKIWDFEYKKSLLLHSFFGAISAVICIYFISISIKFFASFVLYTLNYNLVSISLEKPVIVFVVPLILLFLFSGCLKACFVVLKSDYSELENIFDSTRSKKSLFDFRYSGDKN
jgi:hypothetical protein